MAAGFFKSFISRFTAGPVDWDELEETLIRADFGVSMTTVILKAMRSRGGEVNGETALQVLREEILKILPTENAPLTPLPSGPRTILVAGVNGTGKTTSCAKLANWLKSQNHSCLLVAADTFRAAAIEQLCAWGAKLGIEVIRSQYQGDAAALCHDAWNSARRRNIEFLLCDTAGRLHTKSNLMQELAKVGYTQSYTYFTWRNTKHELTEYLTELTQGPMKEYFRANFFANTPDILPEYLQQGGGLPF